MKHNKKEKENKQSGDVLGISDTPASTQIPQAARDRGGHPEGIEIGEQKRHWGAEAHQPSSGVEGVDMGAGGGGTDIEPSTRRKASRKL